MYSTTVYLYQQIQKVLLVDTSGAYFTARYNPVYAKQLTINKGVDNVLLFEFINQEQKPVNVTGSTFIFRLLSQDGSQILVSKEMVALSANLGRVKVVLEPSDTDNIVAQPASYSIERISGSYEQAVFTNGNSAARGDANVVDSVYPEFIDSREVTIPTVNLGAMYPTTNGANGWPDWGGNQPPYNQLQLTEFYSSHFNTYNGLVTLRMNMLNFTGTVKVQSADTYQSPWYDVSDSTQYLNKSGQVYMNVLGFYPLLRLAFNKSIGTGASATATVEDSVVTTITIKNGGLGYIAAPNVTILGDGAGAIATAEINDGTVTNINLISGGSGYWPANFSNTDNAVVVINTGFILDILAR